jgi:Leucine-rich repeat (LRR) protein
VFAKNGGLGAITRLGVADSFVGRQLRELAPAGDLDRLTELDVSHNHIEDIGAIALARAGLRLRRLELERSDLTDGGLDELLDSPMASSLVRFGVGNFSVSDFSLTRLLDPGAAPALRWLHGLDRTQVSPELREALAHRYTLTDSAAS